MNDNNKIETRKLRSLIIGMQATDGSGVKLTRVIKQQSLQELNPILLPDEFRTDNTGLYCWVKIPALYKMTEFANLEQGANNFSMGMRFGISIRVITGKPLGNPIARSGPF